MYKTISTKDVDVSSRVALFNKVDGEQKELMKEKPPPKDKEVKTARLKEQLRLAKEERDRLLTEINDYELQSMDAKTPLESIRRTEFYKKLQDEEGVQKNMKLEFEVQRILEENRKLEADLEELKSSGASKHSDRDKALWKLKDETKPNTELNLKKQDDRYEQNERTQSRVGSSESVDNVNTSAQNTNLTEQDVHKEDILNTGAERNVTDSSHDSLMSILERPENKNVMGATLYRKDIMIMSPSMHRRDEQLTDDLYVHSVCLLTP